MEGSPEHDAIRSRASRTSGFPEWFLHEEYDKTNEKYCEIIALFKVAKLVLLLFSLAAPPVRGATCVPGKYQVDDAFFEVISAFSCFTVCTSHFGRRGS